MQHFAETVTLMEDGLRRASDGCLRSELINRCFLSSLYEAQLAAHSSTANNAVGSLSPPSPDPGPGIDTVPKAMRNLERAAGLAAQLGEFEVLTHCAIGLAELHISRRDLPAAAVTFDACVASCVAIPDASLRAALLQRVLPKSMEVCNMQGRIADSFSRLRLLNSVLALSGRAASEECPICGDAFTRDRACLALGCGHSFHRDCCDCWLGRKMFVCGAFRAECPVCGQVDWSIKPTPAAARALEEFKVTCGGGGGGSASGSNGALGSYGFENEGGASGGGSSSTSNGSSSSSSTSDGTNSSGRSGSGENAMHGGCVGGGGGCVMSRSSSCSGSSSVEDSDGESEDGGRGADCAESEMRWEH